MTKEEFKLKMAESKEKITEKAKEAKEKISDAGRKTVCWVADHPTESIGIATACGAAIGGVNKLVRAVDKKIDIQKEDYRRKTEKYDAKTGSWIKLKRPLTAREEVELAERRENGESLTLIMDSFGVLKR